MFKKNDLIIIEGEVLLFYENKTDSIIVIDRDGEKFDVTRDQITRHAMDSDFFPKLKDKFYKIMEKNKPRIKKPKKVRPKKPVSFKPKKDNFVRGKDKTAKGYRTNDIDDDTAKALRGKTIEEVYAIVSKNLSILDMPPWKLSKNHDYSKMIPAIKIEYELKRRLQHLKPGMQRMLLGNRLRAMINRYNKKNKQKYEIEVKI